MFYHPRRGCCYVYTIDDNTIQKKRSFPPRWCCSTCGTVLISPYSSLPCKTSYLQSQLSLLISCDLSVFRSIPVGSTGCSPDFCFHLADMYRSSSKSSQESCRPPQGGVSKSTYPIGSTSLC